MCWSKIHCSFPASSPGGCWALKKASLRNLLQQIQRVVKRPWLRPLTSSLKAPGSAEELTLPENADLLAVTPDGQRLITGTGDGLKIWNLEYGVEEYAIPNSKIPFDMTPDANCLVYAQKDNTHAVWNLEANHKERDLAGPKIWRFSPMAPDRGLARPGVSPATSANPEAVDLRIAANGRNLGVSASASGDVKIWNLHTGQVEFVLGNQKGVKAIAITPDDEKALLVLKGGIIQVWNLETRSIEKICLTQLGDIKAVSTACLGEIALATFAGNVCRVWDLTAETEITLVGIPDQFRFINISSDRQHLWFTAGSTESFWNLTTGMPEQKLH